MPAPPPSRAEPLGVVLAGGAAARFPGKLGVVVDGEVLLRRAVGALGSVLREVVVLAKDGAEIPAVPVSVWREPAVPRHPLFGVAWAIGRSGGRAVLVAAGDMPAIGGDIVRALAAYEGSAAAFVPGTRAASNRSSRSTGRGRPTRSASVPRPAARPGRSSRICTLRGSRWRMRRRSGTSTAATISMAPTEGLTPSRT